LTEKELERLQRVCPNVFQAEHFERVRSHLDAVAAVKRSRKYIVHLLNKYGTELTKPSTALWDGLQHLRTEYGLTEPDLVELFRYYQGPTSLNIEEIEKRAAFLRSIGLSNDDLRRLFPKMPGLLCLGVDTMASRVDYLASIGVDVKRVISRIPSLLSLHPERIMKKHVEHLRQYFNIDLSRVARMVTKSPTLIYMDQSHIDEKVEWLKSLGWSSEEILRALETVPQLASLSLSRQLIPKMRYLVDQLGVDPAKIKLFPTALMYSMQRLHMRLQLVKMMGETERMSTDRVNVLLPSSDAAFISLMGITETEFREHCRRLEVIGDEHPDLKAVGSSLKLYVPTSKRLRNKELAKQEQQHHFA
jgi:hypothetical protein